MIESGYYPPGAEFDPRAPWNETEEPTRAFKVCVSQTLSKNTKVATNDYISERGKDEDGVGFINFDTSDTDWKAAYSGSHYTPLELVGLFKEFLEKYLPDPVVDIIGYKKHKNLIKECEGWVEDEFEIIED